ncbi:MAG: murein hydrolase activator EnvC family protein [Microthrixaceae bacterium]
MDAPVVDGFRMDAGPYGPGNRGLEYDTEAGTPVRSVGAGRVVFVGPVAGRWALTVQHPDGRRSSLTGIVAPRVAVGELVATGQVLALAADRLHLGVREGERYVDPAALFAATRRRAVLVPLGGPHGS